jgi:hypothetical protein
MFKWLLRGRLRARIESDVLDARSMLSTMKLKLHKEGAEATVAYGEGVGAVAGLLAQRFQISVPAALEAKGLDWRQLSDAADDLSEALARWARLVAQRGSGRSRYWAWSHLR